MDMTATRTRAQRLIDERVTVTKLHEDLQAHVEGRPDNERSYTDVEANQIAGYRTRQAELDEELAGINQLLEREEASVETSKHIRAHLAGRAPGVTIEGGETRYSTFAAFARDAMLVPEMVRGHHVRMAGLHHEIINAAGGDMARDAARERLLRTPEHTLSQDVEGLQPAQHIAQLLDVINASRPVVASGQRIPLTKGRFTYPKITQRPEVEYQGTAEKTEGGTAKMVVDMESGTADTFIGGGNLSWQTIEWSDPSALDLWFRIQGANYAKQTDGTACGILIQAADANAISPNLNGTSDSFEDWLAAVLAGASAVLDASEAMSDTLWLSPDMFFQAAGVTSSGGAQLISAGNLNVAALSGTIASLKVVVSTKFKAKTAIVGDSSALLVAETPNSPVQLRAVEPAIGGLEVGVIGAFKAVAFDDGRFAEIGAATP